MLPVMLTMLFLSGCLVSSLHPFYKAKDRFFEPAMVGTWIDGDSCIWTIEQSTYTESFMGPERPDSSYRVTYFEDDQSKAELKGTLFRLNGVSYVDFTPDKVDSHFTSEMTGFHHIPVHTLARVQFDRDSILIYWYGDEWLNRLFEENRIRIKHETIDAPDYDRHVLTASTDELQKFIKKFADDPRMVREIERIFATGSTEEQDDFGIFLKLKPYEGPVPEGKDI